MEHMTELPDQATHDSYIFPTTSTPEEEEEMVDRRLIKFWGLMEEEKPNSHKFDMVALKRLRERETLPKPNIGYHPIGVHIGQRFRYRAELVVCGIHTKLMGGIDYTKDQPCNAIVMAGKYRGDHDLGDVFEYSGEGGVRDKQQYKDQEWTKGNSALRQSLEEKKPVKVVRYITEGSITQDDDGGSERRWYSYDGLYLVTHSKLKKEGRFNVCVFTFTGIPGEYRVSGTVHLGDLYHGPRRIRVSQPRQKKAVEADEVVYGHMTSAKNLISLEKSRGEFLKRRGNVTRMDISGAKEAIRIPLINDLTMDEAPPDFTYVTSLDHTTDGADRIIAEAKNHFAYNGCQRRQNPNYDEDGLLCFTIPEGIKECPLRCKLCSNSIVSSGIRYPLEVFMTEDKGWGVRCSVDIPCGAFICEYTGEVLTDAEVEQRVQLRDSTYLYSLDHFFLMKKLALLERESTDEAENRDRVDENEMPTLPLSDEDIKDEKFHGHFLVIDAKNYGNVGRFLNHACRKSANIVAQMVLCEGCNGIFHHVGFFAIKAIPKYTELVHDYGWNKGIGKDLHCKCKDPECKGVISG